MKWWITIFVFLVACNPKVITKIQEMVIHDTILISNQIDHYRIDTFENSPVSNYNRKPASTEKMVFVERLEVKNVPVVKTVYGDPGMILYEIPDSMILGNDYKIRIRIQRSPSSISREGISRSKEKAIRTSHQMEVSLSDPSNSFKISKVNSDQQIVEKEFYTEWIFHVSPIKPGERNLNLIVSIITEKGIKQMVFEDTVIIKNKISIHVKSFWSEHWQWIFSTLLIPIFIYFWNKRKERSKQ